MCEINPTHTLVFRLEAFTSNPSMTSEEFTAQVMDRCLNAEQALNADGRFRFHIHELGDGVITITPEMRRAIARILGHLDSVCDEGPTHEGWKSDHLKKDISMLEELIGEDIPEGRKDNLPGASYGILCHECGPQGITTENYFAQMRRVDSGWQCPVCHGPANWDDDRYEQYLEKLELEKLS